LDLADLESEGEAEKSVTHVLVRESKSRTPKKSPAKTRKAPARKQEPTIDSSNYEFSKDYSEEERAYQELQGRSGAHRAAVNIKETHYEDDEDEEEEGEEEEEEEEEEEDEEEGEEDYEHEELIDHGFTEHEEPEEFIIRPRQSLFSPVKNAIFFTYFFIQNIITSTFHTITSFISRLIELFIYTPILWIVDSFKSLFHTLNTVLTSLLTTLGATTQNPLIKKAFATILSIALLAIATPPTIQFLQHHHVLDTLSKYRFPQFGPSYVPPDLPPGSASEIIDRLLELERQLSSYSSLSNQILSQNQALRKDNQDEKIRRGAIDDSIYLLKADLEKLHTYAKNSATQIGDLKSFNKDSRASIKDLHTTLINLDAEVEKHSDALKRSTGKTDVVTAEIKSLKSNIDALKRGLHVVEGELKRVGDFDYISNVALKAIEGYLPGQLAVRVHPKTKKIDITPEFWTALRGVFADRGEMDKTVAREAGKIVDAKVVQKEISWGEFLRGNEEAIKGFVKVQMDDRWNRAGEDGVIVSRDYFLEILKDQVGTLRGDMDSKTRQLMDKFEKSSKENVAKAVASAEAVVKRGKKTGGKDLSTEAMNSIVETALHRYATDTLAKPDYALYSSGARINPHLTSPTYFHHPTSLVKRFGSFLFGGAGSTWGHQPAMALFQDTNVGMCWAFPGAQGGLGIRLSETVLITDVSVEHIHQEVSKNIGSAPRQWSLYALIPDATAREQINSINTGLYESIPPANLPRGYTLLVRGEYDINNEEGKTIQTIPVPAAIRRLNVPVEQVVFAVGSNWGNNEYTCLYRVRVHGQGLHEEDEGKGFGDDEVV
jgi:Sad1 / UNC-like C-terminal